MYSLRYRNLHTSFVEILGGNLNPKPLSRAAINEKERQKKKIIEPDVYGHKKKLVRSTSSGRNSEHLSKIMSSTKSYSKVEKESSSRESRDLMGEALDGPVKRHTLGQDYLFKREQRRKQAEDKSRLNELERKNIVLQSNLEEYQRLLKMHGLVDKTGKVSRSGKGTIGSESVTISSDEDLEKDLELHKQMLIDEGKTKDNHQKKTVRYNLGSRTPPSQSPIFSEHGNLSPLSDQMVNEVYAYNARTKEKLEQAKAKMRSRRQASKGNKITLNDSKTLTGFDAALKSDIQVSL